MPTYNGVDFEQVRKYLNEMLGVGPNRNPSQGWMGPHWYNGQAPANNYLTYGQTPSEADVQRYINENYGGVTAQAQAPVQGQQIPWGRSRDGMSGMFGGSATGNPLLDQLLAQAQGDKLRANVVNDQRERNVDDIYRERERQADAELTAMRDRVMGEVDNWGGVRTKLADEAAATALSNIRTHFNQGGFNLATHMPSYIERNARDTQMVKDQISEQKSDRKVRYDSQLTSDLARMRAQLAGDRAAFQERPTDQGPDMNQILQLAMQYGQGNNGQGFFDGSQSPGAAAFAGAGGPKLPRFTLGSVDLFGLGGQRPQQQQQQQMEAMPTPEGPMYDPMAGVPQLPNQDPELQRRIAARRAAGYQRPRGAFSYTPGNAANTNATRQRALQLSSGFRLF